MLAQSTDKTLDTSNKTLLVSSNEIRRKIESPSIKDKGPQVTDPPTMVNIVKKTFGTSPHNSYRIQPKIKTKDQSVRFKTTSNRLITRKVKNKHHHNNKEINTGHPWLPKP